MRVAVRFQSQRWCAIQISKMVCDLIVSFLVNVPLVRDGFPGSVSCGTSTDSAHFVGDFSDILGIANMTPFSRSLL